MLKHFLKYISNERGTWAMTAAAVVGVGGGLLNSSLNNSKPGQVGYNVVNYNDPQDLAMRQQSQGFMSDALNGIKNGQGPSWMNNTLNPMQQYLMQQNQQQMFGMPGNAGGSIADAAQSQGAAQGLGGAAAMAPMNNVLAQYGQRMNGINQYINNLKYNTMNQEASSFPSQLYQTAQPHNQVVPMNYPGTPNSAPQFNFSGLAQPLGNLISNTVNPGINYVPQQINSTNMFGLPSQTTSQAQNPNDFTISSYMTNQ